MRVKCPNCGAEFDVPDKAYYVICPYCSVVLKRRGEAGFSVEAGHFYYPISQRDPYRDLVRFIYRSAPVPDDFIEASDLRDRKLYYIPLYSFYVEGTVSLYRLDEFLTTYKHAEYVTVPAVDIGMASKLLAPWNIALEGKRIFDPSIKRMGEYYEPRIHPFDISWLAELVYKWWTRIRIWRSLGTMYWGDVSISTSRFTSIIHYPVWMIKYYYGGRIYEAYVDGVDNRVIIAEHPGEMKKNLKILGYIAGLSIASAIASYYLTSHIPLLENLRFIVVASTMAIPILPFINIANRLFRKNYVSSVWSEEEILDMLNIFIEFPY